MEFSRGINLSGGENNAKRNPAVYSHDYIYPSPEELDYYAQKGFAVVRLPYRWERLQRGLFGDLDGAELGRLKQVVSTAADRHMQVILSPHNFGRYLFESKEILIGTNGVAIEAFADFSSRVAQAFAGNDALYAISLMNEPHDSQNLWKQTAQARFDAIRRADGSRLVLPPGDQWSGASSWKQFNDDFVLNDPANRIVYEAHQYFDIDHSGTYKMSYSLNGGTPDRGVEWVRPFAEWLKRHGQRGILTEFGVPNNDPRWLELTRSLLVYLAQEKIPWTYWAGGPWWGDYPLSAEPTSGIDAPIVPVLTKNYGMWRTFALRNLMARYRDLKLTFLTLAVGLMGWIVLDARFALFSETRMLPTNALSTLRALYAVNQASPIRGSISVYNIDRGHRLVKTISTASNVDDVRGVAVNPAKGKLYVSYRTKSGVGMIYCLDIYKDVVVWNRAIKPDVDRLAISPDGRLLYVPSFEDGSADYINVLDADSGDTVREVYFSNRSHDSQFPLSGPLFQETKATDGSGKYLYMIDPSSYAVSRIGPYSGILGPYAVDSGSRHVVNNVTGLWGMQVADIRTGQIVSAIIPEPPPQQPGLLHGIASAIIPKPSLNQSDLMHGIGWTPDETEAWQNSSYSDPHVYVWDMSDPMAPKFKAQLALSAKHGGHWLTFDLKGNNAYIAPAKNSEEGTEIFDPRTHKSVGSIGSSEDMVEIDFMDGVITRAGDQYGIGRVAR